MPQFWPISCKLRGHVWPHSVKFGRHRPVLGRLGPHLGRARPNLGQLRPTSANVCLLWPSSGQNWLESAEVWPMLAPNLGRLRPDVGQLQPTSAELGGGVSLQSWAALCHTWPGIGQHAEHFDELVQQLASMGRLRSLQRAPGEWNVNSSGALIWATSVWQGDCSYAAVAVECGSWSELVIDTRTEEVAERAASRGGLASSESSSMFANVGPDPADIYQICGYAWDAGSGECPDSATLGQT